jgi:hypothetical protein
VWLGTYMGDPAGGGRGGGGETLEVCNGGCGLQVEGAIGEAAEEVFEDPADELILHDKSQWLPFRRSNEGARNVRHLQARRRRHGSG